MKPGQELGTATLADLARGAAAPVTYAHLAAERHGPATPSFWLGPAPPRVRERFDALTSGAIELGLYRVRDAAVLGRGLVVQGGRLLLYPALDWRPESLMHRRWRAPLEPAGPGRFRIARALRVVDIDRPAILLMRRGDHVYGHWLLDVLPRLTIARRLGVDAVACIISRHTPPFGRALLAAAGVQDGDVIELDEEEEVLFCPELLVPSATRAGAILPGLARETFAELAARADTAGVPCPERIFLPRAHLAGNNRRLVNGAEAAECLAAHGFEPLRPEDYPPAQQFALFRRARVIVGEAGSAPHNSAFAAPGTRVAILQGNHAAMVIQSGIGRVFAQPTGYLFGESFFRPGNGINGDWLVSIRLLGRMVRGELAAAGLS